MPSKGIKCFTYISVDEISIEFTTPKQFVKQSSQRVFSIDSLEVESSNLPAFKFTGRFEFVVRRDGRELTRQWVDVNSMTGNVEEGTVMNMDQTPSIFVEDIIICYGFYDAGPGHAGLPNQHQCYVTVTRNNENWMREVLPVDDERSNRPFRRVVLPAAHDIGMNSMETSLALLKNAGTGIIKELLGRSLPSVFDVFNRLGDGAINRIAPDIIRALAITQKDSLDTVLKLGARYFEFRPAKCHREMQRVSPLEDTLYFQHGAIPGMPYRQFLKEIVQFLQDHVEEIVVVHHRWDGVPEECPRPSDDELREVLDDVRNDRGIELGSEDDMMNKSVRDLRNDRQRLIVLQNASQASNYDDAASATLTGDSIVDKLNAMSSDPPGGRSVILLQCQATATNIRDVVIASVLDANVSTSPILATKPVCDAKVLPLLTSDVGRALGREDGVVVVLNDFFCGGTAEVGIHMCRERMG